MNAVPHKSRDGKPVTIFHFPDLRWRKTSTPPVGDQACFGGFTPGVHSRPAASDGGPRVGWGPFLTAAVALAVLIASVCLSACTVASGKSEGGSYLYASVGGNAKMDRMGSDGMSGVAIDNSTGLQTAGNAASSIGWARAAGKAFDALNNWIDEDASVQKNDNATAVKINQSNNDLEKATFVPPEPAPEIAAP